MIALAMQAASAESSGLNFQGIILILGALLGSGGLGGILTWRAARKDTAAKSTESLLNRYENRINTVEKRLDASKKRERIRDDYINVLRKHINDNNPPPAPPFPVALTENSDDWE